MKNLKFIPILALIFLVASCASSVKFPVSSQVPGADIVAKKKQEKNGNYKLTVTAKYLAAVDRMTSKSSNYVVWVKSQSDETRCIGRLINKNGKTVTIESSVPFNFMTVFITIENKEEVSAPSGLEIARVEFKK